MGGTGNLALAVALAVMTIACGDGRPRPPPENGPETPRVPTTKVPAKLPAKTPDRPRHVPRAEHAYVYSSSRCGECHMHAFEQWESSPHAHAATGALYVAMRDRPAANRERACADCHAPLAAWLPEHDPIADEGVACDGCHGISEVTVTAGVARMNVRLDENTKYGPLCDARDHYFHRMGCADELFGSARYCAGCHDLVRTVGGREVPIYSEFREWSAGPYATEGVACQSCHMPDATGEVATGSPERNDLSHHGFFGSTGNLRARAVELRVTAEGTGDRVAVAVSLTNKRAGHAIPSGMPGRRIIVRARAMGADGTELGRAQYELGRVLAGASGEREVPHHEATRVVRDERIGPRETRQIPLELAATSGGELVVEVIWRALSEGLAAELHVEAAEEQVLATARMTLGPPGARRRIGRARIEGGGT